MCLLTQDAAFGAAELAGRLSRVPALDLSLPRSVAIVESVHDAGPDSAVVYLIQDAHANESAQRNIASILDRLAAASPGMTVFLEGGSGDDSLSHLRRHGTASARSRLFESHFKRGHLQGPDYYDLTGEHPVRLFGVEDKALYFRSLERYRRLVEARPLVRSLLDSMARAVGTLKGHLYGPGLARLDQARENFLANRLALTDYLAFLLDEARRRGLDRADYPQLGALEGLKQSESRIDFDEASRQQLALVRSLPAATQLELTRLAAATDHGPSRLGSSDPRREDAFYALLEEAAPDLGRHEQLAAYVAYLRKAAAIDATALVKEKDALERRLFDALAATDDEKRLLAAARRVELLERLFALQLSREDFRSIEAAPAAFDLVTMTGYLNRKLFDLADRHEDIVYLQPGFDEAFAAAREFYELTESRDRAFLERITGRLRPDRQGRAALVAGGYHSDHLKALLARGGYSYVSILPRVAEETNLQKYETLLLGQLPPGAPGAAAHVGIVVGREYRLPASAPDRARPYLVHVLQKELGATPSARASSRPPEAPPAPAGARLALDAASKAFSKDWKRALRAWEASDRTVDQFVSGLIRAHDRTPMYAWHTRGEIADRLRPIERERTRLGSAGEGVISRALDFLRRVEKWRIPATDKKRLASQKAKAEKALAERMRVSAILETAAATPEQKRAVFADIDGETRAAWLRMAAVLALSAIDAVAGGDFSSQSRLRERVAQLREQAAAWTATRGADPTAAVPILEALRALSENAGVWSGTRARLGEAARRFEEAIFLAEAERDANRPRFTVEENGQMAFDFGSGARLAASEDLQALKGFLRSQVRDYDRKASKSGLSDARLSVLLDSDDPGDKELNTLFKTFNLNRGQRQSILAWVRRRQEAARTQAAGPAFDGEAWVTARLAPVVGSLWTRAQQGVGRAEVLAALEPLARELDPAASLETEADPRPSYRSDDVYGLVVKSISPRLVVRGTHLGRPVSQLAAQMIAQGRPPLLTARVVGTRRVTTPDGNEAVFYQIHDPSSEGHPGRFGAAQASQDRYVIEPVDTIRGVGTVSSVAKQLEALIPAFQEIRRLIGPDLEAAPVVPPFLGNALHRTGFHFFSGLNLRQAYEQAFWAVAGAEETNHFDAFRFAFRRLERQGIERRAVESDISAVALALLRDDRPQNFARSLLESQTDPARRSVVGLGVIELEARLKAMSLEDRRLNPYPAYTLMTYADAQHGVYALVSNLIAQALAPELGAPANQAVFEQQVLPRIARDPAAANDALRRASAAAYAKLFWTTAERRSMLASPQAGARLAARPGPRAEASVDWIDEIREASSVEGARLSKAQGLFDPGELHARLVQEKSYLDSVLDSFHGEVVSTLRAQGREIDEPTALLARESVSLYYLRAYFLSISSHPREDLDALASEPVRAADLVQAIRYFQRSPDPYARRLDHPEVFRMILESERADPARLGTVLEYFKLASAHFNSYLALSGDFHYEDLDRQYQRNPLSLRRLMQRLSRRQQQAGLVWRPDKFYRGFRHRRLSAGRPAPAADYLPAALQRPVIIHNASFASGATINHPHQQVFFLERDFLPGQMAGVERAMWDHPGKLHWYEWEDGIRFGEFFGWPGTVAVVEADDYWRPGADRALIQRRLTAKVHEIKERFLAAGLTFNAFLSVTPELGPRYLIFPRRKSERARKPIPEKFKDSWSAQAMAGMFAARDAEEYRALTTKDVLRGFDVENPGRVHEILELGPPEAPSRVTRPIGEAQMGEYLDAFLVPARSTKTQPKALSTSKPPGSFLYYYWPAGEKGMRLGRGFSLVPNVRPFAPEHWVIITDGTGVQEITPEAIANSLDVWHDLVAPQLGADAGARLSADEARLQDLVLRLRQQLQRTPYHSPRFDPRVFTDLVERIEEIEIARGDKSPDDFFTVEHDGVVYPVHPYRTDVPGARPAARFDVTKADGETVRNTAWYLELARLGAEAVRDGRDGPVVLAVAGRPGSGKTHVASILERYGIPGVASPGEILVLHTDDHLIETERGAALNVSDVIYRVRHLGAGAKAVVIEGVHAAEAFGPRKLTAKPDVLVFVRTSGDERLRWERIVSRPASRQNWRGPEYFLRTALVRDIEQRYSIDPLAAAADLVIDTSVSASAGARLSVDGEPPAERRSFEGPDGHAALRQERGLWGLVADVFRIPRNWVASSAEAEALRLARRQLHALRVSYTGSIVRYTPGALSEQEDAFGREAVSISPLKGYRPAKVVSEAVDGRTVWVAAERHAIFVPDALLARGDGLLTSHSYGCSVCYGRLTTPDGRIVHMMSHQDSGTFGRITLSTLEELFRQGKIVSADLTPLAYGTDRAYVENQLAEFAPALRNRLRETMGDAADALRVTYRSPRDKSYGTALTFTNGDGTQYLHDWSFWSGDFGNEATVVDWSRARPSLVAAFTPAPGPVRAPPDGAAEPVSPRAPPDGAFVPRRGIHADEFDSLSGARLSEAFRNFIPEQNPIPERVDRIPVSTAIFVMLPTAGGNKKVSGDADMLSVWLGRLFEEVERLDAQAERRGERYHVEVVVGENSDASDKAEVLESLQELMSRYKEESRSGRGLRVTVLNLPPRIGKSATVNELYREARRRYLAENARRTGRGVPPLKMYLHFMDDDSYLVDRQDEEGNEVSQILRNVDLLRDEERSRAIVRDLWGEEGRLKAVGTTPVRPPLAMPPAPDFTWTDWLWLRPLWSYLDRLWTYAFQHLSNVRKENLGVPLAQIYGQSYTLDIDDYPEEGIPIDTGVDDCFLSIWLKHVITNPDAEHEHAEPATLDVFIRRYWRDRAHGRALDHLARELGQEDIAAEFQRVRKASHDRWTERFQERYPWYSAPRALNLANYLIKRVLDWLYDHGWAPKRYYDLRFGFVRGTNIGNVRLVSTRVGSQKGYHIVTRQGVITMPSELLWMTLEVMGLDADLNASLTRAEVERRLEREFSELSGEDLGALRLLLAQIWNAAGQEDLNQPITVQDFVHALSEHRELEQSVGWKYLGDYLRRRKIVLLFDMVHNSDNWLVARAALARLTDFVREEAHEEELSYLVQVSQKSKRPLLPSLGSAILDRAREYPGAFPVAGRRLSILGKRGQRVWLAADSATGETLALTLAEPEENKRLNRWAALRGGEAFVAANAYDEALGVRLTPQVGRPQDGRLAMSFHQYASRPHSLGEWTHFVTRVAEALRPLHGNGFVYGDVRRLNALVDVSREDPFDVRLHVTGAGAYEWSGHLDPQADLYGLGALLYFGFAYRDPFVRPLGDGRDYLPLTSVPAEVNRIIRKALGKTEGGYASIDEMIADLQGFQKQIEVVDPVGSAVFENVTPAAAAAEVLSSLGVAEEPGGFGIEWQSGDYVIANRDSMPVWNDAQLRRLVAYQENRPGQRWQHVRLATSLLTEGLRQNPGSFEAVLRLASESGQALQPLAAREALNAAMAIQRAEPERLLAWGAERLRIESSIGLDTYRVHDQRGGSWVLKITDAREKQYTESATPGLLHPQTPHEPVLGALLLRHVPGELLGGVDDGRLERLASVVGRFAGAARRLAEIHAAGVVHRDALPHNFRLDADGTVVPIDFGLSEAALGDAVGPYLDRSDVMLLSAGLEQALTGQPRWTPLSHGFRLPEGGPGGRIDPTLPSFLTDVIRRGINREVSTEELADELERAHQQLIEPRYTSPFDGRSMQQQLRAVYDQSIDAMSATVRRTGPAGARLAARPQDPAVSERLVRRWLSDWKHRPDPLEMAEAIRDLGLTEWDILRAARGMGLTEPVLYQTYTELDSLVPYLVAAAKAALEAYGGHRMLLLGRDAENVYDVLRVLLQAAGTPEQARLFPGSMDFWRLPKPFDAIDTDAERSLKTRFFASYGLTAEAVERGEKFLILDAGFAGSVAEELQKGLAAVLGWDESDPRLTSALVSRLISAQNKFQQMVRFKVDAGTLERVGRDFPKSSAVYPVRDEASFDFLIGTALQLLPRFHDVYAALEDGPDGPIGSPAGPPAARPDLDDLASPNDSVVHPLAALLVQHRLVSRLIRDLESGAIRVSRKDGRLSVEAGPLPVETRARSTGARLAAGRTVLVYDDDEIRNLLEGRADKLQVLLRIHDKLYGPMRETARQILSVTPVREGDETLLRGVLAQLFVAITENAIDAYLEQRSGPDAPPGPLRIEIEVFHPDGDGRVTVRLTANGIPYRAGEIKTRAKRDGSLPALGGRGEGLLNVDSRIRRLDPRSRWRLADRRELVGDADGSVFEWSFRANRIDGILARARRHDLGGILPDDGGYSRLVDEARRLAGHLGPRTGAAWPGLLRGAVEGMFAVDPLVAPAPLDPEAVAVVYRAFWGPLDQALRRTRAEDPQAWRVFGPEAERLGIAVAAENGFTWQFWETRFHAVAAFEAAADVYERLLRGDVADASTRAYYRRQLEFFRTLGERAFSITDWDGTLVPGWLASVRGVLRHDEAVRLLDERSRSDLRVAERHLDRLSGLGGARLSGRLDPGTLELYERLERFLSRHRLRARVNSDGTVYDSTPFPAVHAALVRLRERLGGDASGRTLIDVGAGDLRVSLVAAALFGMNVIAVEKDRSLSRAGLRILRAAREEGLPGAERITYLPETDALEIPWERADAALFYYTEPGDEIQTMLFRDRLATKLLLDAPAHFVMGILFTGGQIGYGFHEFSRMTPLAEDPELVFPSLDGHFLQTYRSGRGARLASDEKGWGLVPYNPVLDRYLQDARRFDERSDAIADEFRAALSGACDEVTRILYPAAHYDTKTALALLRVMPAVREVVFVSHYEFTPTPERSREHQRRIEENLREQARARGIDTTRLSVRVIDGDYLQASGLSEPAPEGGITAVVDKYPGRNSSLRADPRFRAAILRDTRPGDLVISRTDHLVPALRWSEEPLATGLTLPYLYDHQNRWSVQRLSAGDRGPLPADGARLAVRQALERLFDFVDSEDGLAGKTADALRVDEEVFLDVTRSLRHLRQAAELYLGSGEHAGDAAGLSAVADRAQEGIEFSITEALETPYEFIAVGELVQDLSAQLHYAADFGDDSGGARLAVQGGPVLFPLKPDEAVRVAAGAFKVIPNRIQLDARLLSLRPLRPGQRSLHVGSHSSLLPVLEALMGLHVFATDVQIGGLDFVRALVEMTGLGTIVRGVGGSFMTDRVDFRTMGDYRPGVLFDHVTLIDVFSGLDGVRDWGQWSPVVLQVGMNQLADKLAPGATVLISGEGVVTRYSGVEYLRRELDRRGLAYEAVNISSQVPIDSADTELWVVRLTPDREPAASGARLAVSDFTQRGGRLNETHRHVRDEMLAPYFGRAGLSAGDAALVANVLVRSRQGLLDYYRQNGVLSGREAAILSELAERRRLADASDLIGALETQVLSNDALGLRIRALVDSYAGQEEGRRLALVERLVPPEVIRGHVEDGVPEWVIFAALRTRFHLFREFDEALDFVDTHEQATGGPAIAWQFLLFHGLEEGRRIFPRAERWVLANQDAVGGAVNAWKFLLAHNLETADRILARSRAWADRHQAQVGGSANAWQIVISYGLKGAGPFVKKASKWVTANQAAVGGPANAWRIVTRHGVDRADEIVADARVWVAANQAAVGGTQNAWRILAAHGLVGADAFVASARTWVEAFHPDVGGTRNAWDVVIKQGTAGASGWVESRRPAADLAVAGGASPAKAWFDQITTSAEAGARLAASDLISRLGSERSESRRFGLASSLGLDVRPSEAGLLDPVYVGHDAAVKQIVNPDDRPLTVVYGGSGVDVSNALLSTNAETIYLVDQVQVSIRDLRRQLSPIRSVLTPGSMEYLEQKYRHGHAVTDVDGVHDPARLLAVELASIGVAADGVTSIRQADERTIEVRFDWGWAGQPERSRTLYLVQADITAPDDYPDSLRDALRGGIDVYYQRAGMAIPYRYENFAREIGRAVRPGGWFATDDFTYRSGGYGIVDLTPKIKGLGFEAKPEFSTEALRQWGYAVLDARRNVLRTHQLHPPYEPYYGFDVILRQKNPSGARLAAGSVEIVYDDELLAELLSAADNKSEVLITIHGTLFGPLLPVTQHLLDLTGTTQLGQAETFRGFLTQLLLPVVENAIDSYLERRAADPARDEPLRIRLEALRIGEDRVGLRVIANGGPYREGESKTEQKRDKSVPALGGKGIGLYVVARKTMAADPESAQWSLADRRTLLGDEDGSVFEWSFAVSRTDKVLANSLFFGHGARLSWASEVRLLSASLDRVEELLRRASARGRETPTAEGVDGQRILARRALRRLDRLGGPSGAAQIVRPGQVDRLKVEAAILLGHALLRRGNLRSASGDPEASDDYESALRAYEIAIKADDGSRKGRVVADGSFVEKALAIHTLKSARAAAARWGRTRDAADLEAARALYERSRGQFKGSIWMAQSARREYVLGEQPTTDLDASIALAQAALRRIEARLGSLERRASASENAGARLAGVPWHQKPATERIDRALVRERLVEIRRQLHAINLDLEPDQRIDPDDLSDQAIEQYSHAVAHFNRFLDRTNHSPARLERAYRAFHYALGKRGLIRTPGSYHAYDHHAEEVGRLFRWLFTRQAQQRIDEDPVAVAAHVFTTLVNLQPFFDGNKRTASLVANFILIKGGYQPFVLSEENASRWAAVVYPADDEVEISEEAFRDFLDDEVFPSRGARLAAGRADAGEIRRFIREHAAALEAFTLELWRAQGTRTGERFALDAAPGRPGIWSIETPADEPGALVLRVEGLDEPALVIRGARERLAALRAQPAQEGEQLTAQGAVAMLRLDALRARMHFAETPPGDVPLAFEIPAELFDGLRDEDELEAQARMLVSQVTEEAAGARGRAYYVSGLADDERGRLVRRVIENARTPLQIGAPEGFAGITVRLVDAARPPVGGPESPSTIYLPVRGIRPGALLGWSQALSTAAAAGAFYGNYFDSASSAIDFDRVKADAVPEALFGFYDSRAQNRLPDRGKLLELLSGRASIQDYEAYGFRLPVVERIPVNLLLAAARQMYRSVATAA